MDRIGHQLKENIYFVNLYGVCVQIMWHRSLGCIYLSCQVNMVQNQGITLVLGKGGV